MLYNLKKMIAAAALVVVAGSQAAVLMIDFDDLGNPDSVTVSGFTSVGTLGEEVVVGDISTTADVSRKTDARDYLNSSPEFTYEGIYEDTWEGDTGSITISGLTANNQYEITMYSFWGPAGGDRIANYTANSQYLMQTVFNGSVDRPSSNEDYAFTGLATSDASGVIAISATSDPTSNNNKGNRGVFFNGMIVSETTAIPEPAAFMLSFFALTILSFYRKR